MKQFLNGCNSKVRFNITDDVLLQLIFVFCYLFIYLFNFFFFCNFQVKAGQAIGNITEKKPHC